METLQSLYFNALRDFPNTPLAFYPPEMRYLPCENIPEYMCMGLMPIEYYIPLIPFLGVICGISFILGIKSYV